MSLLTLSRIIPLTFSPSKEFKILTIPMRQPQSITREIISRIMPEVESPMSAPEKNKILKDTVPRKN